MYLISVMRCELVSWWKDISICVMDRYCGYTFWLVLIVAVTCASILANERERGWI